MVYLHPFAGGAHEAVRETHVHAEELILMVFDTFHGKHTARGNSVGINECVRASPTVVCGAHVLWMRR